jgi:hypothetical protein
MSLPATEECSAINSAQVGLKQEMRQPPLSSMRLGFGFRASVSRSANWALE